MAEGDVTPVEENTTNPETAPVPETAPPPVIEANDAEGRQPGDPNATIELPPEVVTSGSVLMANRPMSVDEMELALAGTAPIAREEGVLLHNVRQDPVVSERTLAEMGLGRAMVQEADEGKFTPTPEAYVDPSKTVVGAAFAPPSDVSKGYSQPPSITSATLAEQEAGRAMVARKTSDTEASREIMRRAAAQRLTEGKPADASDLNYVTPRG